MFGLGLIGCWIWKDEKVAP